MPGKKGKKGGQNRKGGKVSNKKKPKAKAPKAGKPKPKKKAPKAKKKTPPKKKAAPKRKPKPPKKKLWALAGDDAIRNAIQDVLKERRIVRSQHKLKELVQNRLREEYPDVNVSESRVRYLAVNLPTVHLDIHCRYTSKRTAMSRCPVCGSELRQVKNQTVFGGTVTLEHRCRKCPYWTGVKRRTPTYYIFTYRG